MPETTAERFARETANHQMTVLRDDGLYRHLRFVSVTTDEQTGKRSKSSFYWFDLITWPGCLTVTGDCGTYTFARLDDMFEFFRSKYGINPQYWAEKLRAPDPAAAKRYSPDKFRARVMEEIAEDADHWPGLATAVSQEILGPGSEWNIEWEDCAREALRDFRYRPAGYSHESKPFTFADAWEWDLSDWDWQFLWCCHAIQWGIRQYDAQRDADEAAAYLEQAERAVPVHA